MQVFTAMARGVRPAYDLAQRIIDAYEGAATPGGVWFRNTRLREIGLDGPWFQVNVFSEFVYDQVK